MVLYASIFWEMSGCVYITRLFKGEDINYQPFYILSGKG